jgi:transposase-like protein
MRHKSWFQQSNLTLQEIMLLTYDIVCRVPATQIEHEYSFSSHTVADWGMLCRETMLVFLEGCSVKIGGPNKTVEIDESKFGRLRYHRGHLVKGVWVFGGVERESGETFLVPVKDRTADTLMAVIRDWIEPDTTVISDSWGAYRGLGSQGYKHRTVDHSIQFVDPQTGAHTNTILSMFHRVKVFLGQYNRGDDYEFHLAHYLFAARCKARGVPPFVQFLDLVANTDLSQCHFPR